MQLIFVFVNMDDEEVGKPVSDYFGATGDSPKVNNQQIIMGLI